MLPEPMRPKPPALLTALASSQPLHQIIPAWIIGFSMLNNWQILLFFIKIRRNSPKIKDLFPKNPA